MTIGTLVRVAVYSYRRRLYGHCLLQRETLDYDVLLIEPAPSVTDQAISDAFGPPPDESFALASCTRPGMSYVERVVSLRKGQLPTRLPGFMPL